MLKSRALPLAALIAVLASLLFASAVGARPSGSGSAAKLTASPNPVQAWAQFSLGGCGYVVGKQVTIVIDGGTFFGAAVDGKGCLVPVSWWAGESGSQRIEAYQPLKGQRLTLMASTTLSVL